MFLEINTSGFALRGEPYPARAILRRALALRIRSPSAQMPTSPARSAVTLTGFLPFSQR